MSKKNFIPKRVGNLPKHKAPPSPMVNKNNNIGPNMSAPLANAQASVQAGGMMGGGMNPAAPLHQNPQANSQTNPQTNPGATEQVAAINKLIAEKNNEGALVLLENAIQKYPNLLWFQYRLSVLYYDLGKRTEALSILEKVCEREPGNPDYAMALGTFYFDNPNRDFQKAIKHLKHALDLKPLEAQIWRNYGAVLYKYGEVQKGIDAIYRALQLSPDDFVTTNALCMYLTEQGRREEGRAFGALGMVAKHKNALEEFEKAKLPEDYKKLKFKPGQKPEQKPGMKNIFSFSLWGKDETYGVGMIENTKMMPQFFPNWGVRVYHDASVPDNIIAGIKQAGGETILVTGALAELNPGMWRFLAGNDPTVYYFCCRDADCRPSFREQAAVHEWVQSGKPFHIMRDDIWHNEMMLAGLWGGISGMLPDLMKLIGATFQKSVNRWHDQVFLKNYIWPMIYQHSLQHDNYYNLFGAKPYPIPRVEGDSMHIGYGFKAQQAPRSYQVVKNESETFEQMLDRVWQQNLNQTPHLQQVELFDNMGKKIQLRRLANSARYEIIRQ